MGDAFIFWLRLNQALDHTPLHARGDSVQHVVLPSSHHETDHVSALLQPHNGNSWVNIGNEAQGRG